MWQILFSWVPKITVDGNSSHEIERHLLLGKKAMTNLDSVLKTTDITLPPKVYVSSVQSLSCVRLFPTPWIAARQASCPSPTPGVHSDSRPLSHWCHPAISPCHPLLLLPPIPPSIRVFSSESTLHIRWPKYGSFNLSINPSSEFSGLISFRIDWFDLLAVQGTLKSLLQNHNLKTSILQRSAFFMIQLSYPYMTPGKTVALTIWTLVNKVMSLFFNMLSRFVIAFFPKSKHL